VLGSSEALERSLREEAESSFSYDFGAVRVYRDSTAASAARAVGAAAFAVGRHPVFGRGKYAHHTSEGRRLIPHELEHVAEQAATGTLVLQRRLLLTGAPGEMADFLAMSESATVHRLVRNPLTNEVTAVASLATPARSPALATHLNTIIDDPFQHAEIHGAANQPGVDIGAFPVPSDLTAAGSRTSTRHQRDGSGGPGHRRGRPAA